MNKDQECPHTFEFEIEKCERCQGTGWLREYTYLERFVFWYRNRRKRDV